MSYSIFDTIVLIQDIPEEGLISGMIGVIVDIYNEPAEAYEVEFCDSSGKTLALLALLPGQINIAKSPSSADSRQGARSPSPRSPLG